MEAFGADINDCSRLLPGGKQRIVIDGYQLPLDFKNDLPYLSCRKPSEAELSSLPHIIMTSDVDWDPTLVLVFSQIRPWIWFVFTKSGSPSETKKYLVGIWL
jgi:hypothetical protein